VTRARRELRSLLATFEVGGPPIPERAVEGLRLAFGAERAAVVGLAPRGHAVSLAFAVATGDGRRELLREVDRHVVVAGEEWADLHRRYAACGPRRVLAAGGERAAEMRAHMLCGASLVAWVGLWRSRRFDADEERHFAEVAELVEDRLRLAHDLAELSTTRVALAASLDALGAACIVDAHGEVLAASAGAGALLEAEPVGTRKRLQGAIHGHPGRSHAHVRRLAADTHFARFLVVLDPPPSDRTALVERAVTRWGLTRRQAEVLGLVTEGASNAAIAATLGVGDRAVEMHVTAILDKAGVASRAALLAAVFGVDMAPAPERRGRP
jgi:DNA-binding CsgD family transcriptional regulator